MAKTYYIVENEEEGDKVWRAHRRGIWTEIFNRYNIWNTVIGTISLKSADQCEYNLRRKLKSDQVQPKVVRVLNI